MKKKKLASFFKKKGYCILSNALEGKSCDAGKMNIESFFLALKKVGAEFVILPLKEKINSQDVEMILPVRNEERGTEMLFIRCKNKRINEAAHKPFYAVYFIFSGEVWKIDFP